MFCPRCGAPTRTAEDGTAICSATGARFSPELWDALETYAVPKTTPRPSSPLTCDPEGAWFCPECGCKMAPSPGFVDCPQCGQGFDGFVNAWLKPNPHP